MPLSEEEQRILAEIEASLLASDPDLARNVATGGVSPATKRRLRYAIAGFVVALVASVLALSVSYVLAFVAFLVAFGTLVYVQSDIREVVVGHFSKARNDLRAGIKDSMRDAGERHGRDAGNPFN